MSRIPSVIQTLSSRWPGLCLLGPFQLRDTARHIVGAQLIATDRRLKSPRERGGGESGQRVQWGPRDRQAAEAGLVGRRLVTWSGFQGGGEKPGWWGALDLTCLLPIRPLCRAGNSLRLTQCLLNNAGASGLDRHRCDFQSSSVAFRSCFLVCKLKTATPTMLWSRFKGKPCFSNNVGPETTELAGGWLTLKGEIFQDHSQGKGFSGEQRWTSNPEADLCPVKAP